MTNKIKTLNREEAIAWFKILQCPTTMSPAVMAQFSYNIDGTCVRELMNDTNFRYGIKYGMLALLVYLFDIKEGDLKKV